MSMGRLQLPMMMTRSCLVPLKGRQCPVEAKHKLRLACLAWLGSLMLTGLQKEG